MKVIALASLLPLAHGHGLMTYPLSRNGGDPFSGGIGGDAANFCENQRTIPGEPTINDRELLTVNPDSPPDYDTTYNPWRAAGSAPVTYPCGELAGRDGRFDLPPREGGVLNVVAGGTMDVAWAINANHGGGYAYRLCKKDSDLSEECFQDNTLRFTGDSWIEQGLSGPRTFLPPVRTTQGTFPAGSQWTKNPIPFRNEDFPNPRPQWMQDIGLGGGDGYGSFDWSVWDTVEIPADLSDGEYLLSFRWDCEYTQQVWLNCGDVVVSGGSPTPAPAPTLPPPPTPAPPTPAPGACTVDLNNRADCGFLGVNEDGCLQRDCCWVPDVTESGAPWCFYPAGVSPPPPPTDTCDMALENRQECGFFGIDEQSCLSSACCWVPDESGSGAPWCFDRVAKDSNSTIA